MSPQTTFEKSGCGHPRIKKNLRNRYRYSLTATNNIYIR